MIDPSLAQAPARTTPAPPPRDVLADRIEGELARLREARPHLGDRIDRATTIVTVHLSSPPRTRPIRCRVRRGGRRVFLVASLTAGGAVYEVDAASWSCSCPDHHRRDDACKHSICCWILDRASLPREAVEHADRLESINEKARRTREAPCVACGELLPTDRLVEVQDGQAEETLDPGMRVCRLCAGDHGLPIPTIRHEAGEDAARGDERGCGDPETPTDREEGSEGLSYAEVEAWLKAQKWITAKTRPDNPHQYCLKRNAADPGMFERVAAFIREKGLRYRWWGAVYVQLVANGHAHWTMGAPIPETVLINRKTLDQVRKDELRNKGGAGVQWRWLHGDLDEDRAELRREERGQDELTGGGA